MVMAAGGLMAWQSSPWARSARCGLWEWQGTGVQPAKGDGSTACVSEDSMSYLTRCQKNDTDETKGWAEIQLSKQRDPAHRIPHVDKVSVAMGGKRSWRKTGRCRPSMVEYRRRRAWKKQGYYMPHMMPYSRSTDVVWRHYDPWPAQRWYTVPCSVPTADRGGRYKPW